MGEKINIINPTNVDYSIFYTTAEFIANINPILFPEIYDRYLVTSWGRIINKYNFGHVFPDEMFKKTNRYITVELIDINGIKRHYRMHRLVLGSFQYIPGCEELLVNHKDGVKWHNEWYNLEWCTNQENIQHAINIGLMNVLGENHHASLLTNEQYHEICKLIEKGYSPKQIQDILNYDSSINVARIVTKIKNGAYGKSISCNYDFSNAYVYNPHKVFTDDQVHKICKYLEENGKYCPYEDIFRFLNIDIYGMEKSEVKKLKYTINNIKFRRCYKYISKDYKF